MGQRTALPKFSVVLPSYNTAEHLEGTIESILSQDYPDIELIVVDGESTDGTLDILRSFGERVRWISEPDNGQSDAINKGFAMSGGTLHYWANADDPLEPDALRSAAELLNDPSVPQWLAGSSRLIDEDGHTIGERIVERVDDTTFLIWTLKWIPTQSVFWNREMWKAAGPFDTHLHYVMDLGLWQRMHRVAPAIVSSKIFASYRLHANSKSLSAIEAARSERKRQIAFLIEQELLATATKGKSARRELAERLAFLLDELADQAVLVKRLNAHRYLGPVMRFYRHKTPWYPKLEV